MRWRLSADWWKILTRNWHLLWLKVSTLDIMAISLRQMFFIPNWRQKVRPNQSFQFIWPTGKVAGRNRQRQTDFFSRHRGGRKNHLAWWGSNWYTLGVAVSDTRPPRLVVDYTLSGTNPNCQVNEHQQLPSAKDVVRTFPLRGGRRELGALSLDVEGGDKSRVVKSSERGLLGFSFREELYFYKVAPFGATFSAHWWGRLGSFRAWFLHSPIHTAHSLFLFVDVFWLFKIWTSFLSLLRLSLWWFKLSPAR